MSDHIEHACALCGSLLHHAEKCPRGEDHSAERKNALLEEELAGARAEAAAVAADLYVPGLWRCPKCNFQQVLTILSPSGVFANLKLHTEPCPNSKCNGARMLRVTWKQSNTDTARALETQLARAVAAEDLLRHIATQCCEVEGDVRLLYVPACVEGAILRQSELREKANAEAAALRFKLDTAEAALVKASSFIHLAEEDVTSIGGETLADFQQVRALADSLAEQRKAAL